MTNYKKLEPLSPVISQLTSIAFIHQITSPRWKLRSYQDHNSPNNSSPLSSAPIFIYCRLFVNVILKDTCILRIQYTIPESNGPPKNLSVATLILGVSTHTHTIYIYSSTTLWEANFSTVKRSATMLRIVFCVPSLEPGLTACTYW